MPNTETLNIWIKHVGELIGCDTASGPSYAGGLPTALTLRWGDRKYYGELWDEETQILLECVAKESQSKLDNHELHQSPDSPLQLYPLTYASEHKQSFDFLQIPPKFPPLRLCVPTTTHSARRPSSPRHNARRHGAICTSGEAASSSKSDMISIMASERLPPWRGKVNQSHRWRLTQAETSTPTAKL